MVGWAGIQIVQGVELKAESADWTITAEQSFTGFALIFLFARAFSSGCTALTGVEAISNGVPAFKKPKVKMRRRPYFYWEQFLLQCFCQLLTWR